MIADCLKRIFDNLNSVKASGMTCENIPVAPEMLKQFANSFWRRIKKFD